MSKKTAGSKMSKEDLHNWIQLNKAATKKSKLKNKYDRKKKWNQ